MFQILRLLLQNRRVQSAAVGLLLRWAHPILGDVIFGQSSHLLGMRPTLYCPVFYPASILTDLIWVFFHLFRARCRLAVDIFLFFNPRIRCHPDLDLGTPSSHSHSLLLHNRASLSIPLSRCPESPFYICSSFFSVFWLNRNPVKQLTNQPEFLIILHILLYTCMNIYLSIYLYLFIYLYVRFCICVYSY